MAIYPQIRPLTVLCLGDSTTKGVGGTYGGYRGYLRQLLCHRYQLIAEAHNGWTSAQILKIASLLMLEETPDIVLLSIGSNDIGQGKTTNEIMENITQTIDIIRSSTRPQTSTLVGGVPCNSKRCMDLNKKLATSFKNNFVYPFIDKTMMADEYHPNDKGYEQIAKAWYQKIKGR